MVVGIEFLKRLGKRNQWIDAEIEKSLNGKRADVGIVWNDEPVAIEVELSPKNAIQNIVNNTEAGFMKTYTCCKDPRVLDEVKRRLKECKDYERVRDKVTLRLLSEFEFVK